MLITVDNKGILRSNLISAATYNVETLQFAISTDLAKENEIYLSIYSTSNKLYDVVHLVPTRVYDSKHDLFTIAQSQSLRVGNNERVILKLLFLNKFKNSTVVLMHFGQWDFSPLTFFRTWNYNHRFILI